MRRKLDVNIIQSAGKLVSEKGTLRSRPIEMNSLVFAEGWPSFTLVLESLGFNVNTYLTESILDNDLILKKLFNKLPKLMKEFEVNLHNTRTDSIVWIQGSLGFVKSLLPLISNHFRHVGTPRGSAGQLCKADSFPIGLHEQ